MNQEAEKKKFAKIFETTNGHQVLVYIEPDGGDYFLHQIAECDGFQADLKVTFKSEDEDENERKAYAAFDAIDQAMAERLSDMVIKTIEEINA